MARNYIQGSFKPKFPEKYAGDVNNIFFRSSWEKKVMLWCDNNPSILKWTSEEVVIPYLSPVDNKMHRYFVDFMIKVRDKSGLINNYLVEVKPEAQTKPPKVRQRKTKLLLEEHKTYAVNQAKWKAAEEWCRNKGVKFIVLTEKHLY